MALNIADLFEHAVDAAPDNLALKVGDRVATYADLERDSNRLAHFLASRGVKPGDHVAIYSKNSIEHVIAVLATVKLRATTINVNYRYVEGELDYLFENADVVALLFERTYADLVAKCAPKHAQLHTFVALPDVTDPDNSDDISSFGGVTLEEAYEGQSAERDFEERSADDIHIIYTGGTTGFPKGVMWRHEDFWRVLGGGIDFYTGEPLEEMSQSEQANDPRMVDLPAEPADARRRPGRAADAPVRRPPDRPRAEVRPAADLGDHREGEGPADLHDRRRDGAAADRGVRAQGGHRHAVRRVQPVRHLQQRRDLQPGREEALDGRVPQRDLHRLGRRDRDRLPGHGHAGQGPEDPTDGPVVGLGPGSVVLDDDNRLLDPATDIGKIGRLGRGGNVPVGYYKDPEKSAATFLEIDGSRYSVPGDFARIEEGNRVTLLGRGSNCVNTGGEKVYPEEVEMAVKAHPAVYDCLVVGIPDEKYGQAVAAVVELREGTTLELEELREFLRQHLSGYKLPRSLTVVPQIPRNATGKAQYPAAKEMALAHVAV